MSRELVLAAGLVLGAVGYFSLAWYVWHHRTAAGSRPLTGVLVAVFLWSTFYALEVTSYRVADAELWSAFKYIGVVTMPACILAFVLDYTGGPRLRRWQIGLLSVVPVLTLISLVAPPTRELIHFWDSTLRDAGELTVAVPTPENGPLFWPHAIYQYVLVLLALGIALTRLLRSGPAYRLQAYVAIITAVVSILVSATWNAGMFGPDIRDPMPFVFSAVAVVLVWGFFRQELLDFLPVARDLVLEQMADGVLVLDVHSRVVDVNRAAAALLGLRPAELKGRFLPDVLPPAGPFVADGPGDALLGDPARGDLVVPAPHGAGSRDLALSVTPLMVRSTLAGKVVLLHDVTDRQEAQRRLHDLLNEQTRVADTLQGSLRPLSLPQVPGLEMAVRFLPAGSASGSQVSGDFYDVHRVLGGDWAFAVGDVSGKGVEAAVVTTMARYTVRTLSAEGRTPREVLEHLNRALLVDESSERFCTLAYGRLDGADLLRLSGIGGIGGVAGGAGRAAGSEGFAEAEGFADLGGAIDVLAPGDGMSAGTAVSIQLTLVLGGHPRPLLRTRTGVVMPVGRPGTALGLVPLVDVDEVTVDLTSGDVLLLYTDGVTEARRGVEQYGEERLAEVLASAAGGLRGRTGVTAAHLVAEAVAERVLGEVTAWASRRDDVALLVLAVP